MLGTGFIAEFLCPGLSPSPGRRGRGRARSRPARTKAFAERTGIGHAATSWDALMGGPGFDAVDLCLPNNCHLEYGLLAAAAAKHILCEKPLGRTEAEARQMHAAADKAGIIHAYGREHAGMCRIFARSSTSSPPAPSARSCGCAGREAHFGPHSPWFWKREESGGGALVDMGCHLIAGVQHAARRGAHLGDVSRADAPPRDRLRGHRAGAAALSRWHARPVRSVVRSSAAACR